MEWNRPLRASKKFCLVATLALTAFGCAAPKPAAPAAPETQTQPADEYLVYTLATKRAFLAQWHVGPDFAAPAGGIHARAKVLIDKDGTVESAAIVEPSGDPQFDASVQQALDQVKSVQPFGAGVSDEQRAFVIDFQLKPRPH